LVRLARPWPVRPSLVQLGLVQRALVGGVRQAQRRALVLPLLRVRQVAMALRVTRVVLLAAML